MGLSYLQMEARHVTDHTSPVSKRASHNTTLINRVYFEARFV
jgi:hypothetical protein